MIVVRADDDVFVGFAGQIGQDVVYAGVEHVDLDVDVQVQRAGKGEGFRLGVCVDLILHGGEGFARGGKPVLRGSIFDLHEQDAGVFRTADAAEAGQHVLFAIAKLAVEHNDGLGAV